MCREIAFDGVLTGACGQKIEVDCSFTPPLVAGEVANIIVRVPIGLQQIPKIKNPCSITSITPDVHVEISDFWYRSLLRSQLPYRRFSMPAILITHVGKVETRRVAMSGACSTPIIRFHLSTTKFFVEHLNAQLNYGASADQTAELFTLATPELGQIVFSKEWVFDLAEASNGTATVHYGYYAAVTMPDGEHELLISHFRKMLDWLSILVRQRIVLLGWTIENAGQRIEVYLDPLDKRLTPFMPPKPGRFIVEDDEFTEVALSGLASWPDKNPEEQEQLSDFSYALAPHLDESTEEKFIFQYRMLEKFIITPKVAARTTLIETEILSGFINNLKKAKIENPDSDQASALNKRLDGFINNIQQDKPSLRHKIDGFISSFMKGSVEDLWPIAGTDEKPGLKEIRDTLSHTDTRSIHHQSLAVAQWHLTILLERLVFKLLELPAPVAIQPGSNILRREFWYERAYWENLQKQTLVKQ